jgi:hypothetical protein
MSHETAMLFILQELAGQVGARLKAIMMAVSWHTAHRWPKGMRLTIDHDRFKAGASCCTAAFGTICPVVALTSYTRT